MTICEAIDQLEAMLAERNVRLEAITVRTSDQRQRLASLIKREVGGHFVQVYNSDTDIITYNGIEIKWQ